LSQGTNGEATAMLEGIYQQFTEASDTKDFISARRLLNELRATNRQATNLR
jgi:hypothetical protein